MTPTKTMDHAAYQRRCRQMTDEQLRFVICDAQEAISAHPDNPNCGYYADEVHYAGMELQRRRKGGAR